MSNKGLIIVISAPSGAGKTTLCSHLIKKLSKLQYSISYTTRLPRMGEKNGNDYFFVSKDEFNRMIKKGKFAEWAYVHGHYYGTPHDFLKNAIKNGKDIILDIDVQGGLKIKESYPDAVLIFVMTPTLADLESRLKKRGKDTEEVIQKRLRNAKKELKSLPFYNYLVINDNFELASNELESIIKAEHCKIKCKAIKKFS